MVLTGSGFCGLIPIDCKSIFSILFTLQGTSGPVSACSWGAAPMLAGSEPEPDVETSSAITGVPPIRILERIKVVNFV